MTEDRQEAPKIAQTPLNRRWVLWYDNPRSAPEGTEWRDNLKKCGVFSTVEEFWSLFNNLKPAGMLSHGSNYHLFVEGVEPCWEDPANLKGGKFVLAMNRKDSREGRNDEWWLFTVLAVIGETMDMEGCEINGCVMSVRKQQDKIALWLKSCDKEVCTQIGLRWKSAMGMSQKAGLQYQSHEAAANTGFSFRNASLFEI